MFVYLITNILDGKQYVGQTKESVEKRYSNHLHCALKRDSPSFLHRAIRKYGTDSFIVKPLIVVGSKEWADYYERRLISVLNTKASFGYNLTDGGEGCVGRIVSEELRQKLSFANKGKKHSEERRRRISEACKGLGAGRVLSEETKLKMSVARRSRKSSPLSEITRKKLSESISKWWAKRCQNQRVG